MGATLTRLGGSALIISTILFFIGLGTHPFSEATGGVPFINHINESIGVWYPSHVILVLIWPVGLLGFLILYRVLAQKEERFYSMAALLSLGFASGLLLVAFLLDGFLYPALAASYDAASAANKPAALLVFEAANQFGLTVFVPGLLALYVGYGLVAASLLRSELYNRWLAWAGIAIALVGVLGYAAGIFGPTFLNLPVVAPFSSIATVWVLILGIFVYRGE